MCRIINQLWIPQIVEQVTRKFRVGDRVKIVGNSHFRGSAGLVVSAGTIACCVRLDGKENYCPFCRNEMQLVACNADGGAR